jgi:fructose-specific PTS system IIA-like component
MSLKHQFICPLSNGVHARPASLLEEVSRNFDSEIILFNQRTGQTANAKSVLAIISADIRHNDSCELTVHGSDEQKAMSKMFDFVSHTLPHCDDAPAVNPPANGKSELPLILRSGNFTIQHGTPAVSGIACGRMIQVGGFKIPAGLSMNGVTNPATEWAKLDEALQKLAGFYNQRIAVVQNKVEKELFLAHRAIARDLEFRQQLKMAVEQRQRSAAGAIVDAELHFSKILTESDSALLRERALDIQDVCFQLLRQIYGEVAVSKEIQLNTSTIVIAESLTPGQFLALDRKFLKGLVLTQAGLTSHTVILARSFGIPTLTGVDDLTAAKLEGTEAIIDADAGLLLTNLTLPVKRYYELGQQRLLDRQERIQQFARHRAATQDGHPIEIGANIAGAEEAAAVFAAGADGIGLFRTEMLFLDRPSAPDENKQFETYRLVLEAANHLPVIIRTLDIGGDKPLDYLHLPAEENPFLGYRALRIYPEFELLFRTQVRALIRASATGKLKLLLPMIATVDEARWIKNIISEEQAKCVAEKIPFDAVMPVGAMIEVPSAAFTMDALCHEFDFFSIGSNDLLQYFMAADRSNTRLTGLYNPLQPAFLRLLKQIVDAAHKNKKWIGVCGEMGGQIRLLPLLAGLGLDELSMAAPVIADIKASLSVLTTTDCRQLLATALNCATTEEVAALLEQFAEQHTAPLIDPELIILNSEATTKEEVIKQAVDRLSVLGRIENSRAVEDAIGQRELTYSTGFGHGFAIPHCKTNAVRFNSLVLVKLRSPVTWNSLDNQPVSTVILFTVRETNSATEHMKVFAKLARQVMSGSFRARLEAENNTATLCTFLKEKLGHS